MISYNIIATGSKGNAVVIEHEILIDCGVPFKALAAEWKTLKLVLLTHIHCDHFQPSTLRLLGIQSPNTAIRLLRLVVQTAGGCRGANFPD